MKAYNEGYKICYNCSFLNQMGEKEVSSLAKQVFLGYHYMIKEQLPVQFHFTSLTSTDEFYTQLTEKYALGKWRVHIHSEDYWDLFPREKIVVLSPDAEEVSGGAVKPSSSLHCVCYTGPTTTERKEKKRNKTKQNKTNQTKPNQPNQTKPNQTKPNQTKPNQTNPIQSKPYQTEPIQTSSPP
ncbi:tRNA methyltransferase, partial [Plasmodium cynomolgi strain B]